MADEYDIYVVGADGLSNMDPVADGTPGAIVGNGKDGTTTIWGKCETPAEPGPPGNRGGDALNPGNSGGNAKNAPSIMLTVTEYSGPALRVLNQGGTGGKAGTGGTGGPGGNGGNAGTQPSACKGVVPGGIGGSGGTGSVGGNAGNAGNAGDVTIVLGPSLNLNDAVQVTHNPGVPGDYGAGGGCGPFGLGGKGTDGKVAPKGGLGGGGPSGKGGNGGDGGSIASSQDGKQPPYYLKLQVSERISS
jgi:hypothetical protein